MKLIKSFIFVAMFATCALAAHADDDIKNQDFNPITTGVNSLSISPARVVPQWVTLVRLPILM